MSAAAHGSSRAALAAVVRLLPRAGRVHLAGVAAGALWDGVRPVLFAVAVGALAAAVPEAARDGLSSPAGRSLVVRLVLVAVLFVGGGAVGQLVRAVLNDFELRFARLVDATIVRACLRPDGIAHLEDPAVADRIAYARGETTGIDVSYAATRLYEIAPQYVAAAGALVVLAGFGWWAPVALAAATLLERRWIDRVTSAHAEASWERTGAIRRAAYLRDLAVGAPAAKEVRVFGLGDWILGRFGEAWRESVAAVFRAHRGGGRLAAAGLASVVAAYAGVSVAVAVAGARGEIGLGALAAFLGAVPIVLGVAGLPDIEWGLRMAAAGAPHVLALERDLMKDARAPGGPADGLPAREVRLEAIAFRYPGTGRDALRSLDLVIPSDRSLAIVGPNGAGKTTLIKLLTRLYEPDTGRITVDGVDLTDLDAESWRHRLAVIFQDFGRYEFTAEDNVALGFPACDSEAVERALEKAGARALVAALPAGASTVLSRRYRDGADLSGGEWQRIALARCFAAVEGGAGVLVLDEPTAALDVRAEAALFDRFLELTRGLTTVLVSHRFSTVRRADRIAVVEHGRVTEEGSHDELMASGGTYARMFTLQAARFRGEDGGG